MRGWMVLLVAGCGRVDFDARIDAPLPDDSTMAVACPSLPGLLFCESFEGDARLEFAIGDVEASTVRAYRGARSQHASTQGIDEESWQIGQVLPFLANGEVYARWYMYLPSTVTDASFSIIHMVEDSLPYHGVIFALRDGNAELLNSESNTTAPSTVSIPRDRWVCAQMHVSIGDTGSFDGSLDGMPLTPMANVDTLPAAAYRNVHSGIYSTSSSLVEVWTDEIAVGTLPIPCD
jgi:hypothetical protein